MSDGQNEPLERFDAYMERCLYADGGFYNSPQQTAGSRGAFITSPEVGPLFGAVVANWMRKTAESSSIERIYDVGSNRGTLVTELRKQLPDLEILGVDYQNADLTPEEFTKSDLSNSIVFANELLDNLPFRYCRKDDGQTQEAFVSGEQLVWRPAEMAARISKLVGGIEDGLTFPVHNKAIEWLESTQIRNPKVLLMIDYGLSSTVALSKRGDWLRTYSGHRVNVDPLDSPGQIDITTDVAFDQLSTPTKISTQAEFLVEHGIVQLVQEGKEVWEANMAAPTLNALRMKSRRSQSKALLEPNGLGSWIVAEWI